MYVCKQETSINVTHMNLKFINLFLIFVAIFSISVLQIFELYDISSMCQKQKSFDCYVIFCLKHNERQLENVIAKNTFLSDNRCACME